jgi:hypothetical protein
LVWKAEKRKNWIAAEEAKKSKLQKSPLGSYKEYSETVKILFECCFSC